MYIPISWVEALLLQSLIAVWGGLLFGGVMWGKRNTETHNILPIWVKLVSSLMIALVAWLWFPITIGSLLVFTSLCFAIAMTQMLLADFWLANIIPMKHPRMSATVAFILGQATYLIGMLTLLYRLPLTLPAPFLLLFFVSVMLILWYLLIFRAQDIDENFGWISFIYAILLAILLTLSYHIMRQEPRYSLIFVGAILQLLSSLLMGWQIINLHKRTQPTDVVWLLYSPAQAALIVSTMLPAIWQINT